MSPYPLGSNQLSFLLAIKDHGSWQEDRWYWGAKSDTIRIVCSLERRGLIEQDTNGSYVLTTQGQEIVNG